MKTIDLIALIIIMIPTFIAAYHFMKPEKKEIIKKDKNMYLKIEKIYKWNHSQTNDLEIKLKTDKGTVVLTPDHLKEIANIIINE